MVGFDIITDSLLHGHASLKSLRHLCLSVCYVNVKIMTYRNIISPFAFYGCVIWSLISKEERRLIVFVKEMQGMILGLRGQK